MTMIKLILPFFIVLYCLINVSYANNQQESKYENIIQLFDNKNVGDQKAEAQTYSASLADPSGVGGFTSSGYSRGTDQRSRYISNSANINNNNNNNNEDGKKEETEEDEEERKPDRLALLLAESKFTCDGIKNGYYADETVGCQIFHYCIDGVKHSWQCPENTVFHQIHLNCVPNTQDICQQSSKYHIVNEYLHKELDERGPNNTIQYHQRFYPDGFDYSGGDPVAQIFQAQAQAAIQKAQQRQQQNQPRINVESDDSDDSLEQPVRPRTRSRPQQQPTIRLPKQQYHHHQHQQQNNRQSSLISNYPPASSINSSPKTTSRPLHSFTLSSSSDAFQSPSSQQSPPPTYNEQPQDDFGNTDFSEHRSSGGSFDSGSSASLPNSFSSSSSSSSSFSNSGNSQNFQPSTSSFSTGSVTSYQSTGSSSSSFRPSSSSSRSGSSSGSSGSSGSGYPTRSLGIPIASFRVAPASSSLTDSSIPSAQASTIEMVQMVPPINFNNGENNYFF